MRIHSSKRGGQSLCIISYDISLLLAIVRPTHFNRDCLRDCMVSSRALASKSKLPCVLPRFIIGVAHWSHVNLLDLLIWTAKMTMRDLNYWRSSTLKVRHVLGSGIPGRYRYGRLQRVSNADPPKIEICFILDRWLCVSSKQTSVNDEAREASEADHAATYDCKRTCWTKTTACQRMPAARSFVLTTYEV